MKNTMENAATLENDWRLSDPGKENGGCQTAADGLIYCIANCGKPDIGEIARLCGLTREQVIEDLGMAIWQNPDGWNGSVYEGWETSDQYLSGQLQDKLRRAREAAESHPALFTRNVRALEAIMPHPLEAGAIRTVLGSPWIPSDVIELFLNWLFEPYYEKKRVFHDEIYGEWKIVRPGNPRAHFHKTRSLSYTYGEPGCNGLALLEKTLNRAEIKNPLLIAKQQKLEKAFQKWLAANPDIAEEIRGIYDAKFGFMRKRNYDGSFLKFPGMSDKISLYPHQRNAAARIIFSGNTLLAHKVGAGKTFTMIAAAMELKRLGRSAKNLFVVPNNVVGQWRDAFAELYPESRVFVVEPGNFTPRKRLSTLKTIKEEDFDGIIMAYSCAERVPLSAKYVTERLEEKKEVLEKGIPKREDIEKRVIKELEDYEFDGDCDDEDLIYAILEYVLEESADEVFAKDFARRLKKINTKIASQKKNGEIPEDLSFDALGITAFFLDESHNYKNIPIDTRLAYVRGINAVGSKKCADMLERCLCVQKSGGIVVLATGTPICNSVTDVYTIQQYLQKGTLESLGIESFDSWAANFGEIKDVMELDVDGSRFRSVNRFVRFHNLPELSAIFNMVADYAAEIAWEGVAECKEREDESSPNTPELRKYVQELALRADRVRGGGVSPAEDNMLKITVDGRKAALDLQLVERVAKDDQGKAVLCANIVSEIWEQEKENRSAQVIFCDLSVPRQGFNIYSKLKKLLVERGVPENEIAFAHDGNSPESLDKLYDQVRAGKIRVIIGSTFKLGLGVNIQDRLIALHHLDVPWRPADMIQREGRILRKGNRHEFVRIFRYVTEGSFDSYFWQILETKQRFIASFLAGNVSLRHGSEMDSHVLSYAEVKALALGNQEIRKRVERATEIEKNVFLQREWENEREKMRLEIVAIIDKLAALEKRIEALKKDARIAKDNPSVIEKDEKLELGELILDSVASGSPEEPERKICEYRNFEIVLRASPGSRPKGIWLVHDSSVYVEIGKDARGCVTRIDNALNNLPKLIKELGEEKKSLSQRKKDLEEEIAEPDPFAPIIAKLNKSLKKLDKKIEEQ